MWVTNYDYQRGVTVFIGAAAPTVTPVAAQFSNQIVLPAIAYSVGGSISGLGTSNSVVLQDNGGDNLSIGSNGSFIFATALTPGSSYSVTVLTQPLGQTCSVSNGSGTMPNANVNNISVICSNQAYTLGGTVTGVSVSGLVLSDQVEQLPIPANSSQFTFATSITAGTNYSVTIYSDSTGSICQVSNGTGVMPSHNVTNISVGCL